MIATTGSDENISFHGVVLNFLEKQIEKMKVEMKIKITRTMMIKMMNKKEKKENKILTCLIC